MVNSGKIPRELISEKIIGRSMLLEGKF